MHTRRMNSLSLLLVHLGSCVLLLSSGALAIGVSPINNIDIYQPILRESPAKGRNSNLPDDMFGWAAIMHQTEVVNSGDNMNEAARKTRIIVGAPRGTYPGGLNLPDPGQPRAEQSGLVYNCPVQPGTCEGIRGDTTRYLNDNDAIDNNAGLVPALRLQDYPQSYIEGRLFDQAPNARLFFLGDEIFIPAENKTGQLLGATLFSNGETFMACAPRWTDTRRSAFNALPRGVCYTSGRNLQNFIRLQPCDGDSPSASNTINDGYCLAGTSALVYNELSFVIGAPGNQEGRGSLYYSASINNPMFTSGRSVLPNAAGTNDPTIRDQYQGFSTVSAFITVQRGSGNPNVVTAVPRYDDDSYAGRILVYNPNDYLTIQAVDARGTQMAEFFGHSMIAVDINGDGYDDLVIGAPMNTDFDALKVERGRVYVFMNNGGNLANEPIIFNGTNPRGRLGTSLANLGDIDRDGFEDFAVGAPYTINSPTSNTGVVYIYYGNDDQTAFTTQVPFEISASDVVNSLSSLSELKTFGFSVSGGVDVDNNQFNDLLVGAYESQLAVLFRSRPVVTVVVDMRVDGTTPVALNSTFSVSVTAHYEGMGVDTSIDVPFNLSEDRSVAGETRLSFDGNGAGIFTLTGPGVQNTQTIRVTSLGNTTILDSHMLLVTIPGGLPPSMAPTDGNRSLIDLSNFPRLRLGGNNTLSVPVTDPCGADRMAGCQFDVRLSSQQNAIVVIANGNPIHTMDLMYENIGSEDAVGLRLNFSRLPEYVRSVAIRREGASPAETPCSAVSSNSASCMLRTRLIPGARENVKVNFTIDQERLTGAEPNMTADLAIDSMTGRPGDRDVDSNNNGVRVTFDVVARAEISVSLSFGGRRFDYTAVAPGPSATVQDLGRSTITLEVDILNNGPTTIREGMVTIYLANRIADTKFTLYPTRLDADNNVANGEITCDESFLPNELPLGDSQIGQVRRRRSASQRSSSSLKRVTRQDNAVEMNTCVPPNIDSGICTTIVCNVTNLRRGTVPFTISVFTRIDERYFAQQPVPGTVYELTTSASVSIDSSFYGDIPTDNTGTVTIELAPMVIVTEEGTTSNTLLHVILWPCIGGLLLLVLAAVGLYFVGFFSRKKKPVEGEIEGDFDVDQFKLKPNSEDTKEPSAPLAAGGGPDAPSEITKV